MNTALQKLAALGKRNRLILGLMSGTSLDGLDIALCDIRGEGLNTSLRIKRFTSVNYSDEFLSAVKPLFANPNAPLAEITRANAWIAREHAQMLMSTLSTWELKPSDIDIIASHGQTIYHAPKSIDLATHESELSMASATLQVGDGDHLAYLTQILTVSDFRQKHVAAMGEGAPLVPYADFLLYSSQSENRILINIGGIANFTYLPINKGFNKVVSTDTGPGNTLMDTLIQYVVETSTGSVPYDQIPYISAPYDANGAFAAKGKVDQELLSLLIANTHYNVPKQSKRRSKSTGQEIYNIDFVNQALVSKIGLQQQAQDKYSGLEHYLNSGKGAFYNLLATLNLFTAKTISLAIDSLQLSSSAINNTTIYLSGGGVHNDVLVKNIKQNVSLIPVKVSDELGISADAKEAALFAVLANQTLFGDSEVFANEKGMPATSFGKISLP